MELDRITSISQIHQLMGMEPPLHPLVTLLEEQRFTRPIPEYDRPIITELYAVSLKGGADCCLKYGRKNYDFQEGSVMFLAPGQSLLPLQNDSKDEKSAYKSWTLVFHPDLIRGTGLQEQIKEFSFFRYESNEALHLSEKEREALGRQVKLIQKEYESAIDEYSSSILASMIAVLLQYCRRFYNRQFLTRRATNQDIIASFESLLNTFFRSGERRIIPTVQYCAIELGFSAGYLSDLLKEATGKSCQEHIYFHLIEKAKDLLSSSSDPVKSIAYTLGFEYSQHFSKLFKNKVRLSPSDYRNASRLQI